ncbi:MAG: helicase-related protein, partial [Eudoraea sp.]
ALHGDLSQNQRDLVMNSFRKKQIQMLVATDVAARGIDVDDITHVINYQLPDEIETYTHRSGRTGRAGKSGISMVIVTRSELRKIHAIEKKIQQKFIAKKIPTGIEICEIQLYHLANKIRTTEINEEVSNYLPAINDVLEGLDRDELIQKIVSVEFTRFFNYYNKTKDLNSSEPDRGEKRKDRNSDFSSNGSVRYFINVGERDGYDWMSLKDFLKDTLQLGKDDLFKVDVKESFSFFNTEAALKDQILETFTDFKIKGRFVNVEVSNSPEGGGGRRRDRGPRKSRDSRDRDRGRGKKGEGSFSKSGSRRSGSKQGSSSGNRRSKKRDGFY